MRIFTFERISQKILVIILFSLSFLIDSKPIYADKYSPFEVSPSMELRINFWEKIFSKFSDQTLVIHDRDFPHVIFATAPKQDKEKLAKEMNNFRSILADFSRVGKQAAKFTPLHASIWSLYSKDRNALSSLIAGSSQIRVQSGLADSFRIAVGRSQGGIKVMEAIFAQEGLPSDLTRIVFVESMFNGSARSKVGAVGFWQLMPATAKPHIRVDSNIDERTMLHPSTRAAAKVLQANYKALESWPLAITAYNHGLGGMKRAVKATGSKNLDQILLQYESPSFGFASRNFYAEFMGAKRAYYHFQMKTLSDRR